ncbi:PEP-CTERM sorting domain-containing protein [Permianibacter sp. IMCC34836]|uniref:THxN family PEP-CTERM protein n=1 Tax=Permianibacter fluminis TaxID=2738515 RepID=UPI001555CEBC|nr:THxN family PEP-CTERM protein [Permianibacter fluminis]NQD36683.1 PEP-CTERM sorting domain-containing protein [Permianibacter fluminis]
MRFIKQLFIAGVALAGASVASADPAIPAFGFETTTGFLNTGWHCEGGGIDANICNMNFSQLNGNGSYDRLAWGVPSSIQGGLPANRSQSYLQITNLAGSIITNGGWVDINYFDHYNHIITIAGGNMEGVNISGLFEITSPISVGIPGVNSVYFDETPNLNARNCPGPNPNHSACDDIFVTSGLNGSAPIFNDGNGWYILSFQFFAGAGTTIVDNGDGTFTIYTTEACSTDGLAGCGVGETYVPGFSRLITQARIDYIAIPVPAPETLALLGLGLMGFALRRPRKQG